MDGFAGLLPSRLVSPVIRYVLSSMVILLLPLSDVPLPCVSLFFFRDADYRRRCSRPCFPMLLRFKSWQSSCFSSLFFATLLLVSAVLCSSFQCRCQSSLCRSLLLPIGSLHCSCRAYLCFAPALPFDSPQCSRFAPHFNAIANRLSAVRCSCLSAPCIALAGHVFASLPRCHSIRCHALALRIFALPFYSQPLPIVSLPCSCAAFLLSAFAHPLMAALLHF